MLNENAIETTNTIVVDASDEYRLVTTRTTRNRGGALISEDTAILRVEEAGADYSRTYSKGFQPNSIVDTNTNSQSGNNSDTSYTVSQTATDEVYTDVITVSTLAANTITKTTKERLRNDVVFSSVSKYSNE